MEIIHFTAEWCIPCKNNKPLVLSFLEENPSIEYKPIDIENNVEYSKNLGILSVPTYLFVKNGEVKNRHIGTITKEQLIEFTK